jgi:putative copper export protein
MILLGSSLFFIFGLPQRGPGAAVSFLWPKRLLAFSTALLVISAIFGQVAQTGLLAGSLSEGFSISNLQAVMTQMNFGLSSISGVGSTAVALIMLTGLVNSWFLVGPGRLADIWTTPYGQVLLAKLVVFAGMLGLAASNRYRLTPALGGALGAGISPLDSLSALRRSIVLETAAAFVVLGLVAWLGTLPPVATVHN